MEPGNPAYNIPIAVRLNGQLNIAALEHSINEIIRRHEALRTSFGSIDGQPVQLITPTLKVPIPVVDLSGLSEAERLSQAERVASELSRTRFDLSRTPLLRTALSRLSEQQHSFSLTVIGQ